MHQGKTDESYTAVGLSNDKKMGDDSVMVCLHNSNDMPLQMYWNSQKPKSKFIKAQNCMFFHLNIVIIFLVHNYFCR